MTDGTPATAAIRVRLFASLREQAGWAERTWPLESAAAAPTPRQLWNALGLPGSAAAVRVAINQCFADPDTDLRPGDELAFLPPISGG
jgi:molybdopterin synthase sulfur carrier subunit